MNNDGLALGYSLRSLGEQLRKNCPENDCMLYLKIYNDYCESLDQFQMIGNKMTTTLQIGMRKILRERKKELERLYSENYAIQCYKGFRPTPSDEG